MVFFPGVGVVGVNTAARISGSDAEKGLPETVEGILEERRDASTSDEVTPGTPETVVVETFADGHKDSEKETRSLTSST
jgi:hypothetical protein